MDFGYSPEQLAWRDAVADMLRRHAPVAQARRLYDGGEGYDPATWQQLTALGAHGVHVAEQWGGHGSGYEELAIVVEQTGAVLLRAPFFTSSAVAASVLQLLAKESEPAARWLSRIATGQSVAAAVLDDPATVMVREGTVSGTLDQVPFGAEADVFLVCDRQAATLAMVPAGGAGTAVSPRPAFDLTAPLARVSFDAAPAQVIAAGPAAAEALRHGWLCATVMGAAEMLGGSQSCLDAAVHYAKQRHQFGRPIGGFQAIKHLCAQMTVELELARSAVLYAVWALQNGDESLPRAASIAYALAAEAFAFIADAALHVHGGMGFTWEHDSHLFLRRAVACAARGGGVARHRELFLAHSGYPNEGER